MRGTVLEPATYAPIWRNDSPFWQRSGQCAHYEPTITKLLCSVSVREMSKHRCSKRANIDGHRARPEPAPGIGAPTDEIGVSCGT